MALAAEMAGESEARRPGQPRPHPTPSSAPPPAGVPDAGSRGPAGGRGPGRDFSCCLGNLPEGGRHPARDRGSALPSPPLLIPGVPRGPGGWRCEHDREGRAPSTPPTPPPASGALVPRQGSGQGLKVQAGWSGEKINKQGPSPSAARIWLGAGAAREPPVLRGRVPGFSLSPNAGPRAARLWEEGVEPRTPVRWGGAGPGEIPLPGRATSSEGGEARGGGRLPRGSGNERRGIFPRPPSAFAHPGSALPGRPPPHRRLRGAGRLPRVRRRC